MATSSLKNRLIDSSTAYAANATRAPMVNPFESGQNGPLLNIGKYLGNSAYISRPIICRVVEFPRWIDYMPDPDMYRRAIKSMMEVQAKIEGLQQGITADFYEQEIGAAGAKQYDVTKATIQQSDLTISLVDKYGLPYQNLLKYWIRYGMTDPEALLPLVSTLSDNLTDALPDLWSMSCLMWEPDPTFRYVQKAWLFTNMGPRNNGQDEASRDLQSAGRPTELSIPFTSLQDTSIGVLEFAQEEQDKMTRANLNPLLRKAYISDINSTVAKTAGGYFERIKAAGSEQIG